MKFGAVPTGAAAGAILAHSLKAGGRRIAKGTCLESAHVERLLDAGIMRVTVAQLEDGDIGENEAASALAAALVPDAAAAGLRVTGAGAGRVNFYAMHPGCALVDAACVNALNAVDPMITLATLAPYTRVEAGTMVGTIKIISYGVAGAALDKAAAGIAGALRVAAPEFGEATLIETQVGSDAPALKGRAATQARLERLGVGLSERIVVGHEAEALADALGKAPGGFLLILTGSATSDLHDVAPNAVRLAGGGVEAFGMPVDPGNLLFFGNIGGRPVIGLPGCARSPALNGADWVLERLLCGVPLTQADIQAMGVGGLLKEIPSRPMPRRSIES